MTPRAYPLLWPEGWPRTNIHSRGPYRTSLPGALDNLKREIGLLCGPEVGRTLILSSNVLLGAERPADPGVVAYFTWDQQALAIPCDRWNAVEHNVQAIALTIEAMRAMDRHGAKQMVRAMFRGFVALPGPANGARPWREVLGAVRTLDELEARYRTMAMGHHPDRGGSHALMAELNAARDAARKELGGA